MGRGGIRLTGRDLIVYILENGLENEPVFRDGRFIGFMSVEKAAEKFGVGAGTIHAWLYQGKLTGVLVGNQIYIPADSRSPITEGERR